MCLSAPRTNAAILTEPYQVRELSFEVVPAAVSEEVEHELAKATRLLTRCRDSAVRMDLSLYEDIQTFLHSQP
jgi:hypothetical protein